MRHIIGNGANTFILFNNWLRKVPPALFSPQGLFLPKGIPITAKVYSIIYNGQRTWPVPPSLFPTFLPDCSKADKVQSAIFPTKTFTIATTWNAIRPHLRIVHWHKLLWFPNCIP